MLKTNLLLFLIWHFLPYLQIAKDCGTKTIDDCEIIYHPLQNNNTSNFGDTYYRFYLNDGVLVYFTASQNLERTDGHRKFAVLYIDINGQKGPNKSGRDIFEFDYMIDGLYPELNGKLNPRFGHKTREDILTDNCNKNVSGLGCAALIMKDGWQIKDDYPW